MVGEGPLRKQEVRREGELGSDSTTHDVCRREWVGKLWRRVDFACGIDHSGENGGSVGMLGCWIENDDVKDLEKEELRPRKSPHCRRACRVR